MTCCPFGHVGRLGQVGMMEAQIASGLMALLREGASRVAQRLRPSLRYLFTTEVHVYASSIAANALLSFFPFAIMLLTVCHRLLHWNGGYQVILEMLRANLPPGGGFVIHALVAAVQGRRRLQIVSLVMLFFTSSGVFLPLEIALNKIWGFRSNRSFFNNQVISFALAVMSGALVLLSIMVTAAAQWLLWRTLRWIPWQWVVTAGFRVILETVSVPSLIALFFLIFYLLPNGNISARKVLPAAVISGLFTAVGKFVYLLSLPMFGFREVYGPFTLSVTMLFWAWVGSLILLGGAHLSVPPGEVREALDLHSHCLLYTSDAADE